MLIGIIYKYISPSGRIYIGQTTDEEERRKTFMNLKESYGGLKINSARVKYGPENFSYEVIIRMTFNDAEEARDKLDELEEFYIRYYDSYKKGYNMTYGGFTTRGFRFSDEQKAALSKQRTGRKLRPRSEDEKAYHSRIMQERWASKEYRDLRAKINASEEHKKKVSKSLSGENNGMYGKKHSLASREKMSASRTGEKHCRFGQTLNDAYREKIRNSSLEYHHNHIVSDETREKISEHIKVKVRQLSLDDTFIAEFDSPTLAGEKIGIDSSCIVKCCKGKRKTAGGYKWEYSEAPTYSINDIITNNEWITTAEAISLFGRPRNVIYYHIKIHGVPIKKNGRKILIYKKGLDDIFK